MVVVFVREHHRIQRGEACEVEPPGREHLVLEPMLRAKVLEQQRVDRDARAIGAKEPTLMTEESDGEHVRACCHEPSRAGRGERLHLDGLFGVAAGVAARTVNSIAVRAGFAGNQRGGPQPR